MLNPNHTNPNRPMKKSKKTIPVMKLIVKCNKKKQNGQARMRTHSPHKPAQYPSTELAEAGEWDTVCTNEHIRLQRISITLCLYTRWIAFRLFRKHQSCVGEVLLDDDHAKILILM